MWIVRLALRRPYSVATFCLVVLLMGVLSVFQMRVDIFPSINIPVVVVVWNYPGLTAEDMERRVTYVTERSFSTSVSGVTRIESQSITGISVIKVYFEQDADIGGAIAQVSASALSASRSMPPGITPPAILRFNASNVPVAQMALSGEGIGETQLYDYALNFIRLRLFTVPGLSTPAPYGGKQRQVMVDVDPARSAAKGLSPQDIVQAVLESNVILPAGSARIGGTDYDVLLNSSPDSLPEFNALPVKVVNGATVYLGDVASVYDGYAVQNNVVRIDGKRATYLQILKKESASTLAVVDSTKELVPQIKASAQAAGLQALEVKIDFDQSVFVRAAVSGVLREAAVSGLLVSLMTLVFLGSWRSTIIVCISIPIAILVGIVGLFLTGNTLNIMTLGGLSLAIGMLVDDATVEVENINRNRHMGKPLTRAILDGAHQVATPALAATLTICIVFSPVVLLFGPARFLFTPLALAVVFSMLASYLLSRTLVPTLARMLLIHEPLEEGAQTAGGGHGGAGARGEGQGRAAHEPRAPEAEGGHETKRPGHDQGREKDGWWQRFNHWRDETFERFQNFYGACLTVALAHRLFVMICFALLVVSASFLTKVVGLDFFPAVDAGIMRIHFRAPSGTRIEDTEAIVERVEERIRQIVPADELRTITDNIGVPPYYNLAFVPSDNIGGSDAEILVALEAHHAPTERYVKRVRDELPGEFPGSVLYFQSADIVSQVLNFGLSAPIDIQVEGRDADATFELASKIEADVKKIPGLVDVRIAQVVNHPSLRVNVDRTRAAQLGLSERDVANSLLTSLSSSSLVSPSFWINPRNNVNYVVAVQTPITAFRTTGDLMSTPVTPGALPIGPPPGGTSTSLVVAPPTPTSTAPGVTPYLGAVAELKPTDDRGVVNHYTVQPVIDVQCGVEGRDLGAASGDIDAVLAKYKKNLPKGINLRVLGQGETMYNSFKSLGLGLILAIALVYLLMVVLFQSWLDPFIIMIAVPGALVGIMWMLTITGTTLNVESFMGAIMAVGIAVSNSILLVNFANEFRTENRDVSAFDAALEAGKTRLRPVLMTALAMILGMLPMSLGLGEGGEQNAPLGRAVIGGLLFATFVTLFAVPVTYASLRKGPPTKDELDRKFDAEEKEGLDDQDGAEPEAAHS